MAATYIKTRNGYKPSKLPPLTDPDNVDSQLSPSDFILPDYDPDRFPANRKYDKPGHGAAVIELIRNRVLSATSYKRIKEPDWYESLAYYLGKQNLTWNYAAQKLVPTRNSQNANRSTARRNKIRTKVKKLTYQAFSSKPDAAIKASTMSDLDRQAAIEGRSLISHLDYKFHRDQQTRRLGHWSFITGTCALKFVWDPLLSAEMPKYQKDDYGQTVYSEDGSPVIAGSEIVPEMGDIVELIVPIFELLMDPDAREYYQMAWIIHQHVYGLDYIREQWPNGKFVAPDVGQGQPGYMESRLAAVLGEYQRGTEPGPTKHNNAVIYECYEPPTDIYPKGRLIICSRDVELCYEESWPHMDAEKLAVMGIRVPYAFMNYEECPGSLYGIGVVPDMISPQQTINRCVAREEDHMATAWGKLLIEEGSRVPVNAFDDARPNEKIPYARGSREPIHVQADPLPPWIPELKTQAEADLDDISMLHEVSDAQTPGNVESGTAIGKLKASDIEGGSMFAANIEEFHRQRASIEIHVAGTNYIEPRLIFINQGYFGDPSKKMAIPGQPPQDAQAQAPQGQQPQPGMPQPPQLPPYVDDTDSPLMEVRAFQSLQNGGSCHVMITAGSALAKDTETHRQEILALHKEGAFGPPGDPTTTGILLSLLDYAGGDEIVEAIRHANAERIKVQMAMAPPPNPLAVQQAKAEADIALEKTKAEKENALENAKLQHEGQILALKAHLEEEKLHRETQAAMMVENHNAMMSMHQALLDKLHPDLKLTPTPVETAAILQTMGVPVPDMQHLLQASKADADTATATAEQTDKMAKAPIEKPGGTK